MSGVRATRRPGAGAARIAFYVVALAVGACGRDLTGPANGLVLVTRWPSAIEAAGPGIAAQVAPFDRVRIKLTRLIGATAVDQTFPTGTEDPIQINLEVPLELPLPLLGEVMTLVVTCLDPAGNAVYLGGPVAVLMKPGTATPPVDIQLAYVGNGAIATTLQIVPNALSVLLGQVFSFSATAFDASGNPIQGAPVVWSLLDPLLATLTSPLGGLGSALGLPGTARIVAQVPDGPADTALLTIEALTGAVATALQIPTSLTSMVAGTLLSSDLVVRVLDNAGSVVANFTNPITVALGQNPGGATLLGTRTVTPTNGVATFDDLSLQKAASGFTLVAASSGLTGATSNAFSVTNAAASILTIVSGDNQSALLGALLGTPLSVRVTDAFANPVAGVPVAWAATLGGGLLGNSSTQTNASGIATNTWALGLLAGLQRASASVNGLTGSPAIFDATGLLGLPLGRDARPRQGGQRAGSR